MNEISVTVYCSAYNHEKYIRDALEGFVKQRTTFDFEVLVHDDASTDDTAKIIKEYELKYPNIIKPIYQTENQYSKGKNRVFSCFLPRTCGKYVAICEGDDYWTDPLKLQKQYDYMEQHPNCSLVTHKAMTLYVDGNYLKPYTNYDFTDPKKCNITAEAIMDNHLIFPTASMFFRKEYYLKNRDFLQKIKSFDYVTKFLLATQGDVYVIPEIMSVYRYGSDGSWTNRVLKKPEEFKKHIKIAVRNLEMIDEYTDYCYHESITKNILQRRFDALVTLQDIAAIKREPYNEIYRNKPLKWKLFLYAKKYVPFLVKVAIKMKNKLGK